MMQSVMFTKVLRPLPLTDMGETIVRLGFTGVDLLIRDGHQLQPDRPAEIGPAVQWLNRLGLSVPMATTDITSADTRAEAVIAACREAGVSTLRLGYFNYHGSGYAATLEAARHALDQLERLAGRHDVRLLLQLHGGTIHGSGAQALALLAGRDPRRIGAFVDPGNQAMQDGHEDWRLTLDILHPWLACLGVENGYWTAGERRPSGQQTWRARWCGLTDGLVPWDDILTHLAMTGYSGLLTLHSHYEDRPLAEAIDMTRDDLAFVIRMCTAAEHGG